MPNSLPYAVFHFKKFVANLIHSSLCAPKIWQKNKVQIILKRFSLGLQPKITYLKGSLLSLAGEAIMEISSGLHHKLWARVVKNPSGTADQNYLKSTENREKDLGSNVIPIFTAQKHSPNSHNFSKARG